MTPESGLYFMRLCSKSLGTGGWWAAPDPGAEMDDRWRGRGEPKGPAVRICKIHSGRRTRHSPEMGTGMRRPGSGPCWDTKSTSSRDRRAARPLSRALAAAPALGPHSFPRAFLPSPYKGSAQYVLCAFNEEGPIPVYDPSGALEQVLAVWYKYVYGMHVLCWFTARHR